MVSSHAYNVGIEVLLSSRKSLLVLSQILNQIDPMWKQMDMLVVHLSGFFAENKSLSRDGLEILSASWRVGTRKRYNSLIERFVSF